MADSNIQVINEEGTLHGSVKIADDVIICIAALAATDVEGVASMAGNITSDLISMFGVKSLRKGVRIRIEEDEVELGLSINVSSGYSIPDVCERVQEKVRSTVENMTGFTVTAVDVSIAGIQAAGEE